MNMKMLSKNKKWMLLLIILLVLSLVACVDQDSQEVVEVAEVIEGEAYLSKEDVAMYLHLYGDLPPNYMTKSEARDRGWIPEEGNLWDIAPGSAIGGDRFGNREQLLPESAERQYFECDVNYEGGHRGAERLVYSDDGLIYYTEDHYNSFEPWEVE